MNPWRLSVGLVYSAAGLLHFVKPKVYEPIVPPPLDQMATEIVYASGVAELVGGLLVLAGARSQGANVFGRWWLLATLAGVFPANAFMAIQSDKFTQFPAWTLWARLPIQILFAAHVWRGTRAG